MTFSKRGTIGAAAAGTMLCAVLAAPAIAQGTETAVFAGGCFWSVESDFDKVGGVVDTTSGYIGGESSNPTYQNHSGHLEAVKITYDPAKVSYDQLLNVYWHSIDPTDASGQFCDRGHSYTTGIFATSPGQLEKAQATKQEVAAQLGTVATVVRSGGTFWKAEDYHQNYHQKNPMRYKMYRIGCGRDATVREVWGDQAFAGLEGRVG